MTTHRAIALSPEFRAALFHFTVFASQGVGAVYFAIWLNEKGVSTDQIGIISAAPVFLMLALNMYIGRVADRASDWRSAIIVLALAAGLIPLALFLANDFWTILVVWTLLTVPAGSIPPVIDAATMRMAQRNGSDFGSIRAWGTVGYMCATASAGFLIAWFGGAAFVPVFVAYSLIRAVLSLQLPRFRAPSEQPTLASVKPTAGRLRQVMRPWFVLPLFGFALVNATHSIIVVFTALIWKDLGIPESIIGPLIAASAAAEALMMFAWKRFGTRISARYMILAACLATIVRWGIMGLNPPVFVLFFTQALHAVTYAMGYFGLVHFIANWTSEEIAAEAQGFASVLQQGVTVVALIVFGWLAAAYQEQSFFAAALLGLAGAICVLVSLKVMPSRSEAAHAAALAE